MRRHIDNVVFEIPPELQVHRLALWSVPSALTAIVYVGSLALLVHNEYIDGHAKRLAFDM
jgi:hypothetical protein